MYGDPTYPANPHARFRLTNSKTNQLLRAACRDWTGYVKINRPNCLIPKLLTLTSHAGRIWPVYLLHIGSHAKNGADEMARTDHATRLAAQPMKKMPYATICVPNVPVRAGRYRCKLRLRCFHRMPFPDTRKLERNPSETPDRRGQVGSLHRPDRRGRDWERQRIPR